MTVYEVRITGPLPFDRHVAYYTNRRVALKAAHDEVLPPEDLATRQGCGVIRITVKQRRVNLSWSKKLLVLACLNLKDCFSGPPELLFLWMSDDAWHRYLQAHPEARRS